MIQEFVVKCDSHIVHTFLNLIPYAQTSHMQLQLISVAHLKNDHIICYAQYIPDKLMMYMYCLCRVHHCSSVQCSVKANK